MNSNVKHIAVIGGGITGLAAAQRIHEANPSINLTLFEAEDRLGGVIQSTEQDGFLFEHSADNFIVSDELPWAGQLCDKLNVSLIPTAEADRGALILKGNTFYPIPEGLQLLSVRNLAAMLTTPLLSWRGKLRVAAERFVPAKSDAREETLEEFAVRRFGREMFERIIQPLIAGIYTADPQKLSMAATLPQFVKQEREHGSLARAALTLKSSASDRGARYSLFRSPTGGMQSLIDALAASLPAASIETRTPVHELRRQGSGWQLTTKDRAKTYDGVICAIPAERTARLLEQTAAKLSGAVRSIEHVSTAVVCLGYHRSQVAHPLKAFGCVIPHVEQRSILAISFTNVKFPTRAPADHVLLRVFLGGALQPEMAELPDDRLLATCEQELAELLGVRGQPVTSLIVRWPKTTPQYHLGHLDRVAEIEQLSADLPGFAIAGNAYRGIGIPQCVRSGWEAADRVLHSLEGRSNAANVG